jgi:hypothetical protein
MLICIRCCDKSWVGSKQLKAEGVTGLRQEIPRRVIRTENQNSASYTDQSNYSWASFSTFTALQPEI